MSNPWLLAIRPKTLFAGLGPVLLGLALSYHLLKDNFNFYLIPWPIMVALLLQTASNLINDYYDAQNGVDKNDRLGPPRVVVLGLIAPDKVKKVFLSCLLLAFSIGVGLSIFRAGWPLFILGVTSIFFSYLYTGGPYPLSHWGMGELLALIFFGPVALGGTVYLETLSMVACLNFYVMAHACSCGLLASAIMAINNLRDRKSDLQARKFTLACILSEKQARFLPVIFILLAFLLPTFLFIQTLLIDPSILKITALLFTLLLPFLFSKVFYICLKTPSGPRHNEALAATGQLLFLYNLGLAFFNLL